MKRSLLISGVIVLLALAVPTSCSLLGSLFSSELYVSFDAGASSRQARVAMEELRSFDESLYAPPFNDPAQRGERVHTATPSRFISGLSNIALATPGSQSSLQPDIDIRTSESTSFTIPPIMDMVYAKDLIQSSDPAKSYYDVVEVFLYGRDHTFSSSPDFPVYSEVHVDLGADYQDVTFPNEKDPPGFSAGPTTHTFELVDLLPFPAASEAQSVTIIWDTHVTEPMIYNTDGGYIEGFYPRFWEGDNPTWNMSSYIIYLPGDGIDVSSGDTELVFSWLLQDLIEVYDNNTAGILTDDLVTLRLDNPVPVSVSVADRGSSPPDQITAGPEDVLHFTAKQYDEYENQVALRWLNPSQEGYRLTRIIRKEGSAPQSVDDGVEVYAGGFPLSIDKKVENGRHYYYAAFVETVLGDLSEGAVVDVQTVAGAQ